MGKTLVLQCPGTVSGTGFRKLEHYVGIEFIRNASDNGGGNGYNKMIGDTELLETLPLFNQIKVAMVKDAKVVTELNQTKWDTEVIKGADGSDVMQVFPKMYAIVGGSNPVYERFIYSDKPFTYDGEDAVEIPSWAETVDSETVINQIPRCIYDSPGTPIETLTTEGFYYDNRTGYSTGSLSRNMCERYTRNKNTDTTSNFPYCNMNYIDHEIVLGMLYVECRTKNLNSVFGAGISSNIEVKEQNWGTVTGIRVDGNIYKTINSYIYGTDKNIGDTAESENRLYFGSVITTLRSLLKVMESQVAVSANNSLLVPVVNADGNPIDGMTQGVMTGVYTKHISGIKAKFSLTPGGVVAEHTIEVVLCTPIWRGRVLPYGNNYNTLSGYDVVSYIDEDSVKHNLLYRAKSIADIIVRPVGYTDIVDDIEKFDFIHTYDFICDLGDTNGWCTETPYINGRSLALGCNPSSTASWNNYQSAYLNLYLKQVPGEYAHKTVMVGGFMFNDGCSLRFNNGNTSVTSQLSYISGRFRCEMA